MFFLSYQHSQFTYSPLNIGLVCVKNCLTTGTLKKNSDFCSSRWFVLHSINEHKTYVSSPAQLIRRQFQNPEPNLGRAHDKKEERLIEKDRADLGEAWKPEEDNLLQQGDSDTQFLQKVSLKIHNFYQWVVFCQDHEEEHYKYLILYCHYFHENWVAF